MTNVFDLQGNPYTPAETTDLPTQSDIIELLIGLIAIADRIKFILITYRDMDDMEDCVNNEMLSDTLISMASYASDYAKNVKFEQSYQPTTDEETSKE